VTTNLEPEYTYETVVHGQVVTVKRYPYMVPTNTMPWGRGFRWDNKRRAPRAADTIWDYVTEETETAPDKNEVDYEKVRAMPAIAGLTDWDKVGSDYNPEGTHGTQAFDSKAE
jgi:hypothetical protein